MQTQGNVRVIRVVRWCMHAQRDQVRTTEASRYNLASFWRSDRTGRGLSEVKGRLVDRSVG